MRNQDLNLLPIFVTLCQERHLSRAAERLGMSQPAVSNALKRLRLSFRDQLFIRTGRGLKPTARAEELYEQVSPALRQIRESFEGSSFEPQKLTRTVEISMNHALEHIWAPVLLPQARKEAPGVLWKFHGDTLPDIPARLRDGRLGFAVEYADLPEDQFDSHVLLKESLSLICAADHPEIDGAVTEDQFACLPHVSLLRRPGLMRTQNNRRVTPLEYLLGSALPERNIALQMSSFVSIPEVVAATELIAVVPTRLAQPLVDAGQLQALSLPFPVNEIELRLYWHVSRNTDVGHQWLKECLVRSAKNLP